MAINKDRTVSLFLEAIVRPGSRILVARPDFIYCGPVAHLTKNVPITVRAGTRGGFGLAPSRLGTTVAPGAGILVLPCPDGPAKKVVRGRSLRTLVPVVGRTGLVILSSRVCKRLACKGGRISVTSLRNVTRHAIVMDNFSGTCTVAN